jgi:hypothetical protein
MEHVYCAMMIEGGKKLIDNDGALVLISRPRLHFFLQKRPDLRATWLGRSLPVAVVLVLI